MIQSNHNSMKKGPKSIPIDNLSINGRRPAIGHFLSPFWALFLALFKRGWILFYWESNPIKICVKRVQNRLTFEKRRTMCPKSEKRLRIDLHIFYVDKRSKFLWDPKRSIYRFWGLWGPFWALLWAFIKRGWILFYWKWDLIKICVESINMPKTTFLDLLWGHKLCSKGGGPPPPKTSFRPPLGGGINVLFF